jgi:hypothetical protein
MRGNKASARRAVAAKGLRPSAASDIYIRGSGLYLQPRSGGPWQQKGYAFSLGGGVAAPTPKGGLFYILARSYQPSLKDSIK